MRYFLVLIQLFGVLAFADVDTYPDKATIIATPVVVNVSQVVVPRNPGRKGLVIYNNSANSVYLAFAETANSSTKMTLIIPTFAHWVATIPIYTGPIAAIRNGAGTGNLLITELY